MRLLGTPKINYAVAEGVRGEGVTEEKKAEKENKENETKSTQHTRAQGLLGVAENYSYPVK